MNSAPLFNPGRYKRGGTMGRTERSIIMSKVCRVFFLPAILFVLVFCAEPSGVIRIGVHGGWGSGSLVEVFNAEEDMEAFKVSGLSPEELGRCDVLVITQRYSAVPVTRAALELREWAGAGNGILFMHGAAGYRSNLPVFGEIGRGGEVIGPERLRASKEHAVTEGVKPGIYFIPSSGYNHVSLHTGESGEALVISGSGAAVLAAGRYGEGRVVLNGIGAGAAITESDYADWEHVGESPEEVIEFRVPEGEERKLLTNSARWLGFVEMER